MPPPSPPHSSIDAFDTSFRSCLFFFLSFVISESVRFFIHDFFLFFLAPSRSFWRLFCLTVAYSGTVRIPVNSIKYVSIFLQPPPHIIIYRLTGSFVISPQRCPPPPAPSSFTWWLTTIDQWERVLGNDVNGRYVTWARGGSACKYEQIRAGMQRRVLFVSTKVLETYECTIFISSLFASPRLAQVNISM